MITQQNPVKLERAIEFLLYNFFEPALSHLPPDVIFDEGDVDLWSKHYEQGGISNIWPGHLVLRLPILASSAIRSFRPPITLEAWFTGEDHWFTVQAIKPHYIGPEPRYGDSKEVYSNWCVDGEDKVPGEHKLKLEEGPWCEQILDEARKRGGF